MSKQDTDELVEELRRQLTLKINSCAAERGALEQRHGKVWSPSELEEEFTVDGFAAPFAVVRRKRDGVVGSLEFQHDPRYYFNFKEDR